MQHAMSMIISGAEINGVVYIDPQGDATREQVADADVILGNIDPDMLTACEHLQLLQLQTAGYDDYLAAGTVPADAKLSCSIGAYGQAVSACLPWCCQ